VISTGETIGGRYKIIKELGHGGMASVYLAEDVTLGRNVAVKVLPHGACAEPETVKNFLNEAKKAAALKHPNIVTIYTVDVMPDGQPYFAIEYLKEDFASKLKLPDTGLTEKLKAVSEVLKGLSYAHEKGVIHRDIKPENIMFNDAGEAVIIDFGIAKGGAATRTMTNARLTKGTPHYMSPEQCMGRSLDASSDLYSLGIVLYEAVAGRVPFSADETTAVMYLHVHEPPDLEILARANAGENLIGVIKKAIAKNPEERFQSAAEFLAALNGGVRITGTAVKKYGTNYARTFLGVVIACLASLLFMIYYKSHCLTDVPGGPSGTILPVSVNDGSTVQSDDVKRAFNSTGQPGAPDKTHDNLHGNPFTEVFQGSRQDKSVSSEKREMNNQIPSVSGADSTSQVPVSTAPKVSEVKSLEAEPRSAKVLADASRSEIKDTKIYYRVDNVASDDVLNIRAAANPKAKIIYKIPYSASGIEFLGETERQNRNVWFKVRFDGATGWVNSKFLSK
jgi:serine/threonine protein kinase